MAKFSDDEGNEYDEDQLRAAVAQMTKDESGQGSLGGLAEGDDGNLLGTAGEDTVLHTGGARVRPMAGDQDLVLRDKSAPMASAEKLSGGPRQAGPSSVGDDPYTSPVDDNADVNAQVERAKHPKQRGRELNPLNFGDFLKDNVFGGLNADYAAGRRPETLFDYATDALAVYGGENVGARNAAIRNSAIGERNAGLKADKYGQEIKTGRANEQKASAASKKLGLETSKLAHEAVSGIFNDVDSDLWEQRMGELEKENGISIPKSTRAMAVRWMEKARELGVTNPADVLDNPDQYDEKFVNRTRHTFDLIAKGVDAHQTSQANIEQSKAASGASTARSLGEERRDSGKYRAENFGLEEAIDVLKPELESEDPQVRNRARSRMSAILAGGTARQKVLEDMSGLGSTGGSTGGSQRNLREAQLQKAAREQLGPNPSEADVYNKVEQLRRSSAAQSSAVVKGAGLAEEAKISAARGKGLLNQMMSAVKGYGLSKGALASHTTQPLRMMFDRLRNDPKYSVISAFPAIMPNIARALGDKGVLTDLDQKRVENAASVRTTDTAGTYSARLDFIKAAMDRASEEIDAAIKEGRAPVFIDLSDLSFDGDQPAGKGGAPAGVSGDARGAARAALEKAKSISDPAERKQFLAGELKRIRGL